MTALTPSFDQFIGLFPQALDAASCDAIMQRFDQAMDDIQPGRVGGGVHRELKHSDDICLSGKPHWQDVEIALNTALHQCLLQYLRHYPYTLIAPLMLQIPDPNHPQQLLRLQAEHITDMDDAALSAIVQHTLRPGSINIQRYPADEGGYPYWHCEQYPKDASCETLHRTLLWSIYLNDSFEAGETEFLYQQRHITPKQGSLLIAPAGFTHTHRGNKPRGGNKYFATSWVLFQRAEGIYG